MVSIRKRAAAGSCLGSILGGILGVAAGVYVASHYAESSFGKGVQGPILIGFIINLITAIVEFGIAAVTGGFLGAIVGAALGTLVSTLTLHKNAEPAHPTDLPGPGELPPEAVADKPQTDLPKPTPDDEQG
jgi:hypothetical protein